MRQRYKIFIGNRGTVLVTVDQGGYSGALASIASISHLMKVSPLPTSLVCETCASSEGGLHNDQRMWEAGVKLPCGEELTLQAFEDPRPDGCGTSRCQGDCGHDSDFHDPVTGTCYYTNFTYGPCPCSGTPKHAMDAMVRAWARHIEVRREQGQ